MKRYISFDLDGTLATLDFDEQIWLEEIPKLYAEKNDLEIKEAKDELYATYFRAWMIEKVHDWTDIKYWFDRLGLENWQKLLEDMKGEISLHSDAIPALESLKDYNLLIISNSNRKFLNLKIELQGLKNYFDEIYSVNSDLGYSQKEPEVYKKVCEKLGIEATELVHIGDDYIRDYMVPQSLGVEAYYLDRPETSGEKRNVVNNLNEFVKVIKDED